MIGPWTRVSDRIGADDWLAFLDAADYESEVRGSGFDVWVALAEALTVWLDEYETVTPPSGVLGADRDPLRGALERLLARVPSVEIPGGFTLGSVVSAAISDWSKPRTESE